MNEEMNEEMNGLKKEVDALRAEVRQLKEKLQKLEGSKAIGNVTINL